MAILPRDSNEKVDVVRLEFACRQIIIERFLRFELLVELIDLRYHISYTLPPLASAKNAAPIRRAKHTEDEPRMT